MLAYLLLGGAQLLGLLLIPYGLPGAWLQLGALTLFGWTTGFQTIGAGPLVLLLAVALVAELTEPTLTGGRIDTTVRRRSGFAGLAGGSAGAVLGLPFPLLGSMFGAFGGALLGSLVATFGLRPEQTGWAALGAQLVATAVRTAAGVVVAVFTLLTLIR